MKRHDILDCVLSAGSENTDLFGGKFTGGYELQQSPNEIAALIDYLIGLEGFFEDGNFFADYLEIGCCGAGLTRLMNDIFDFLSVTVVDLGVEESFKNKFEENINAIEQNKTYVNKFIGNSHGKSCKTFLENCAKKIDWDLVVIDGDHSYDGALADTDLVLSLVDSGCLIVYHDTAQDFHEGPVRLVNELKNGLRNQMKHIQDFVDSGKPIGLSLFKVL
jgi:hypothetical protein